PYMDSWPPGRRLAGNQAGNQDGGTNREPAPVTFRGQDGPEITRARVRQDGASGVLGNGTGLPVPGIQRIGRLEALIAGDIVPDRRELVDLAAVHDQPPGGAERLVHREDLAGRTPNHFGLEPAVLRATARMQLPPSIGIGSPEITNHRVLKRAIAQRAAKRRLRAKLVPHAHVLTIFRQLHVTGPKKPCPNRVSILPSTRHATMRPPPIPARSTRPRPWNRGCVGEGQDWPSAIDDCER